MNKTIKVKIIKATYPTLWYVHEVGEEYEVELQNSHAYNVFEDIDRLRKATRENKSNVFNEVRMILNEDCILV
jgi:hypothetical protein